MDRFEENARARLTDLGGFDMESFGGSFVLFRLATQYLTFLERSIHRPRGISTAGFRVLFTLWVYDELEPRQMAKLSGVSTAAVSGVLGTLEGKGLIQKERTAADKRLVQVRLTPAGSAALVEMYQAQNAAETELFGDMSGLAEFTEQLRRLMDRIAEPESDD